MLIGSCVFINNFDVNLLAFSNLDDLFLFVLLLLDGIVRLKDFRSGWQYLVASCNTLLDRLQRLENNVHFQDVNTFKMLYRSLLLLVAVQLLEIRHRETKET